MTKPQEDSEIHIESFSNNDSVGYKLVDQSVEEVVWLQEELSSRNESDDDDDDDDDEDDAVVFIEIEPRVTLIYTVSDEYVILYIDQ